MLAPFCEFQVLKMLRDIKHIAKDREAFRSWRQSKVWSLEPSAALGNEREDGKYDTDGQGSIQHVRYREEGRMVVVARCS